MNEIQNNQYPLSSLEEHHAQTLQIIRSATRNIFIHCHDLTNKIYNHPDIADALTHFIIQNSASRQVRILVYDVQQIVSSDHKILEASRKLSSNIKIHKLARQHANHTEAFILVDSARYIIRKNYLDYKGLYIEDAKEAKTLLNVFNELWLQSQPDSTLNRLYI